MNKFKSLTTLFIALTISSGAVNAKKNILFLEQIDDSAGSLTLPVDDTKWTDDYFGYDVSDGAVEVTRKDGEIVILSDFGNVGYAAGGLKSASNLGPYILIANIPPISIPMGEELSMSWEGKVQTVSTKNPLSAYIADDDYRRGSLYFVNVSLSEPAFAQGFLVTSTEIYATEESYSAFVGGPLYRPYFAYEKVADKQPDDLIKLELRYNTKTRISSWLINGNVVRQGELTGTPLLSPVVIDVNFGIPPVPFPAQIDRNLFIFGFEPFAPLHAGDPNTGLNVIDPYGLPPGGFPVGSQVSSYNCVDVNGDPLAIDEPGHCPLFDGMKLLWQINKVKAELIKADDDDDSSSDDSSSDDSSSND